MKIIALIPKEKFKVRPIHMLYFLYGGIAVIGIIVRLIFN